MKLLARYHTLLHLAVLLAQLAFGLADDAPMLMLLSLLVVGTSWLLGRSRDSAAPPIFLPRLVINLLLIAAILFAAVLATSQAREQPLVSILGQFLSHMLLIKLFDRRSSRDEAQVLVLSVFVSIAAVLTGNQFLVGIGLFIYTPIIVALAMLWQLRTGRAAAIAAAVDSDARSFPETTGPHAARAFAGVLSMAVLAALVMASVIFVFAPRGFGNDVLGQLGSVRERSVGFRDNIRLGEAGLLSSDPTPVMDVRLSLPSGENIGSTQQLLYLRGSARDFYNPKTTTWEDLSVPDRRPIPGGIAWRVDWGGRRVGSSPPLVRDSNDQRIRVQEITMRGAPSSNYLFMLWQPFALHSERTQTVSFFRRTGAIKRDTGPGRLSYRVESVIMADPQSAPDWTIRYSNTRVRDFTLQVLRDRGIDPDSPDTSSRTIASAIRDYLRTQFAYTVELVAPPEGADPIEFFLFNMRQGHCEYFASAMAAMLQSIGMHARVVSGYVTGEYNTLTQQYLVRESNAHGWVEVFLITDAATARGRWETFDPSPPGEIERIHRAQDTFLTRLRGWYETIEFGWSTSIIGFDSLQQSRLLGRSSPDSPQSRSASGIADRIASFLRTRSSQNDEGPAWWLRLIPFIPVAGIALFLCVRILWPWLKARLILNSRSASLAPAPVEPFYAQALATLATAGIAKPDWSPPMQHGQIVSGRSSTAAAAWDSIVSLVYRRRFSSQPLSQEDLNRAQAHALALQQSLATDTRPPAKAP